MCLATRYFMGMAHPNLQLFELQLLLHKSNIKYCFDKIKYVKTND
jgi:hypothetical protein|nr:hypothetical protein [Mucilaginibacter sp. SP1R1]